MTNANGAATDYFWSIEQDELVTLQIPVLDSVGSPFDVTGWTVDAKLKAERGGTVLYTFTPAEYLASGTNVELTILPATSLAWVFRHGWHRTKVVHPSDPTQKHRILQGRFRISLD